MRIPRWAGGVMLVAALVLVAGGVWLFSTGAACPAGEDSGNGDDVFCTGPAVTSQQLAGLVGIAAGMAAAVAAALVLRQEAGPTRPPNPAA